jgi:hypothetical protein
MVASPKLSRYFYEYEARNRRRDPLPDHQATPTLARAPARRRGFAAGTTRTRLTHEEREILIGLLKATRNAAEARRQFIEAGHTSVSKVAVSYNL